MMGCTRVRIKSKGVTLTILKQYFACAYFFTIVGLLPEINDQNTHPSTAVRLYGPIGLIFLLLAVFCPLGGWLGDVRYDRYKVMRFAYWIMWISCMVIVMLALLANSFCEKKAIACKTLKVCGYFVSIMISVGFVLFEVNAVQFSMDQIPEASSDELSALIRWLVCATAAGVYTARIPYLIKYCVPGYTNHSFIAGAIQLIVPAVMLTLAIVSDFLFRRWLIREPGNESPLRTIACVLKFATTHNCPVTYRNVSPWLEKRPSRIDLAKQRYGGPYTSEQVEDVKTFFRITAVLVLTSAFFIPFLLCTASVTYLAAVSSGTHCRPLFTEDFYAVSLFATLVVPLYEFFLRPFVRNRTPSMLVRVKIAAVLTVVLTGALLLMDSVEHAQGHGITCMFDTGRASRIINLQWWLRVPFNFCAAVGLLVYTTSIAEFTYAQSPYSMRGLLMGSLFSVLFINVPIAAGIFIGWSNFQKHISPSCDFYYFLFQFLCAVVGLIVLCAVTRWYKWRQREEEDDQRHVVERFYERLMDSEPPGEESID